MTTQSSPQVEKVKAEACTRELKPIRPAEHASHYYFFSREDSRNSK